MNTFLDKQVVTLLAGEKRPIEVQGEQFLPYSCFDPDGLNRGFELALADTRKFFPMAVGLSIRMAATEDFNRIMLHNPNDVTITLTFFVATANVTDYRLIFNPDNPLPVALSAELSSMTITAMPPVVIENGQTVQTKDLACNFSSTGVTMIAGGGGSYNLVENLSRRYALITNKSETGLLTLVDEGNESFMVVFPRTTAKLEGTGYIQIRNSEDDDIDVEIGVATYASYNNIPSEED